MAIVSESACRSANECAPCGRSTGRYIVSSHVAQALPEDMAAALVDGLAAEMPRNRIRDYFAAKPEVLREMDWTVCARDRRSGRFCAFLCASWLPHDGGTVMLYTLLIGENHQRGRVTFLVLRALFDMLARPESPDFRRLILKTAHPRSYRAMEAFEDLPDTEFYPSRTRRNTPRTVQTAVSIAKLLHPQQSFDEDSGAIFHAAGAVPTDFYPEAPASGDASLNQIFVERVGLSHRMLCVLELASERARQALFRRFRVGMADPALEGTA